MNNDPYDTGTPKYLTASAIYDGLQQLTNGEEIDILSQMFSDVSYDGQDYYYIDKGNNILQRFEQLSDYGNKMWLLDLAAYQIDRASDNPHLEIYDFVYEALINDDLAKRIGFKQVFIEHLLYGYGSDYKEISTEYLDTIQDLNRFDFHRMGTAFQQVMANRGREPRYSPYGDFCHALVEKCDNLRIPKEVQLISECQSLLSSYDDFILGLRANQALYEAQEQQYRTQAARLQSAYEEKVRQLYLIAERSGIGLTGIESATPLEVPPLALPATQVPEDYRRLIDSNQPAGDWEQEPDWENEDDEDMEI